MDTRIAYIQSIIHLMWGEGVLKKNDGDIVVNAMIAKFQLQIERKVSC
jgi:hypothetical protein